jgi:lipopolysaccharide transport system ATP-binding protein
LLNPEGDCIFNTHTPALKLSKGLHKGVCHIPGNLLNDNDYTLSMMVIKDTSSVVYNLQNVVSFEVKENRDVNGWHGKWQGYVRPKLSFTLNGVDREDDKLKITY